LRAFASSKLSTAQGGLNRTSEVISAHRQVKSVMKFLMMGNPAQSKTFVRDRTGHGRQDVFISRVAREVTSVLTRAPSAYGISLSGGPPHTSVTHLLRASENPHRDSQFRKPLIRSALPFVRAGVKSLLGCVSRTGFSWATRTGDLPPANSCGW
jgi:hypothetical protein